VNKVWIFTRKSSHEPGVPRNTVCLPVSLTMRCTNPYWKWVVKCCNIFRQILTSYTKAKRFNTSSQSEKLVLRSKVCFYFGQEELIRHLPPHLFPYVPHWYIVLVHSTSNSRTSRIRVEFSVLKRSFICRSSWWSFNFWFETNISTLFLYSLHTRDHIFSSM
jgi:hypothetical protein